MSFQPFINLSQMLMVELIILEWLQRPVPSISNIFLSETTRQIELEYHNFMKTS